VKLKESRYMNMIFPKNWTTIFEKKEKIE